MEGTDEIVSSALSPAGPQAETIARLWWWMLGISGAVFLVVFALLVAALYLRRTNGRQAPPGGESVFILVGGVLVPLVILSGLLVYMIVSTARLVPEDADLTIQVRGYMWWWDVYYPDADVRIANELYLPVSSDARIELSSADVIHSFWVPSLAGKTDAIPGHTTIHWLRAERAGTYRGICAEFCGLQHANMSFRVVALPAEEFAAWLAERKEAIRARAAGGTENAHELFVRANCDSCHTVRGTSAAGTVGPDLTHVGSRLTLGSGTVPNNLGNLAGWIANPQAIKPGNLMPRAYLSPSELQRLTNYLATLR